MIYINTNESILNACIVYGAKMIYNAASKRLEGDKNALTTIGLDNGSSLAEANNIMTIAFGLIGSVDRSADLAEVTINLAKI